MNDSTTARPDPAFEFFSKKLMFSSPRRIRQIYDVGLLPFQSQFRNACVLDLACNIGYWSHTALVLGASHVTGVDAQEETLSKARANLTELGIDQNRFTPVHLDIRQAVHEITEQQFDIILCMGVLYHFVDPVSVLWDLAALEAEYIFIDTSVSFRSEPVLEYVIEATGSAQNASGIKYNYPGRNVVGVPSESLIWKMLLEFGYDPITGNLAPVDHTGYSPNGYNRKLIQWFKKNPGPRYHRWKKTPSVPTDWVLKE